METTGLVTAAFVLSTLSSLATFSLLIYCAIICYTADEADLAPLGVLALAPLGVLQGVPALVMFIVATISAAHSGKVFSCYHFYCYTVIIEIGRWFSAVETSPRKRS